jgi:hypothetical protein
MPSNIFELIHALLHHPVGTTPLDFHAPLLVLHWGA